MFELHRLELAKIVVQCFFNVFHNFGGYPNIEEKMATITHQRMTCQAHHCSNWVVGHQERLTQATSENTEKLRTLLTFSGQGKMAYMVLIWFY